MALLSLLSSMVFAQEQKEGTGVPAEVIDAFGMLYAKVENVDWKLIEKNFEVSFVQNERAVSAVFDQQGNLMMVKNKIDHTELPIPIAAKLKNDYPDWSVQEAILIDITGASSYYVELQKAGDRLNLTCSRQGDILEIL